VLDGRLGDSELVGTKHCEDTAGVFVGGSSGYGDSTSAYSSRSSIFICSRIV
jgi:hypothetical protein